MRIRNFKLFEGSDNTFPIDDIKTLFGDFEINWRDSQEFKMGVFVYRGIDVYPTTFTPSVMGSSGLFAFVAEQPGEDIENTMEWKRKVSGFGSNAKTRTTACKIFFMIGGGTLLHTGFNETCDRGFDDSSFLDKYQEVAEALDRLTELGLKYFISHAILGSKGSFEITIYQPFK